MLISNITIIVIKNYTALKDLATRKGGGKYLTSQSAMQFYKKNELSMRVRSVCAHALPCQNRWIAK